MLNISGFSPHEVKSVRFNTCACKIDTNAVLRDGRSIAFNGGFFMHWEGERSLASYGHGESGLPVVVVSPQTGKPILKRFSNFDGLVELIFDPPAKWRHLQANLINAAPDAGPGTAPEASGSKSRYAMSSVTADQTLPIGSKVCRFVSGARVQEATNMVVGGRTWMREGTGMASLVGFVERQEASRAQIRIGGINFNGEMERNGWRSGPMDSFDYKGSQLRVGAIIWDDAGDWRPCN